MGSFFLGLLPKVVANFLARVFKDWRRDRAIKEAGKQEQRLDNLEAREESRKATGQTFREVEGDNADLRNDL